MEYNWKYAYQIGKTLNERKWNLLEYHLSSEVRGVWDFEIETKHEDTQIASLLNEINNHKYVKANEKNICRIAFILGKLDTLGLILNKNLYDYVYINWF